MQDPPPDPLTARLRKPESQPSATPRLDVHGSPGGCVRSAVPVRKGGAGREGPAQWLLLNDLDTRTDRALSLLI